jgi:hypothetical protein
MDDNLSSTDQAAEEKVAKSGGFQASFCKRLTNLWVYLDWQHYFNFSRLLAVFVFLFGRQWMDACMRCVL